MARKTPEGKFNDHLDKELNSRLPGCEILKLDPMTTFQGVPDKLVLYDGRAAILETKAAFKSEKQPNQEYHVERLSSVAYTSFINPDNCDEVLDALQSTLRPEG